MMLSVVLPTMAQQAVGDWRIHTSYVGTNVQAVADTPDKVYYLSEGNLFRLDKDTEENEALSIINDLSSGDSITMIYYNSDKDYVVATYKNADIDVIRSDGSVVNMPEIKDAVMTSSKTINDVTFAPEGMYVATDFGYLVINDSKFVVKESHIYGQKLVSVIQVGDKLLLSAPEAFYYGDADEYHETLASFTQSSLRNNCHLWPIKDDKFFCVTSGTTYLVTMTTGSDGKPNFDLNSIIPSRATVIQKAPAGYLLNVPALKKAFKYNADGEKFAEFDTPNEQCSSYAAGDGSLWAAGPNGLHPIGEGTTCYMPNALTYGTPFWMTYNKSKDMLYVSSPTANAFFKSALPSYVNTYDGAWWKDATPEGAPKKGTYWIEFLPDDPNTYFVGGWTTGLYKVVNDEIAMIYNESNSPLVKYKGAMHPVTSIDRYGNLWVVQSLENEEHPVMVLPADKTKLDQTTAADWVFPRINGIYSGFSQRASFISTKYSNYDIKIFTDGNFERPIFFWNSGGELTTNPENVSFGALTDQDGQSFSWTNIVCLAEDLNGIVWMGCTEGVVSFNPAQAFSGDFRVNHIKVPRNDGTGMADYLLDGIQVNGITVDGANRKWIATQTSGLFLVSADGTQVINRFNTSNSPLASNTVYKVCCDPNSNSVFITTPEGLYEYFSDSSPAEPNYSNIYAYPNPVRPEFAGNVTITGMMDNSLVKIADASGNVICQLRSTGGMATWDCCNQWGEPVKTGVYMVLCSQANGSGEAVVTKIAVIR